MTYWDKLRALADQMEDDGYNLKFERGADAIGTLREVAAYLDHQDANKKKTLKATIRYQELT